MKKALSLGLLTFAGIASTFAQTQVGTVGTQQVVNGSGLLSLLALAQTIVSRLVPFGVGLAVVVFFWFLINFIWIGKDKPDDQQKNLKGIGYSVLALFVMVSIWGIIALVGSIFGIGQGGSVPIPGVPVPCTPTATNPC